jgi:glycosyltransferase involved in cell wall biosynthesis
MCALLTGRISFSGSYQCEVVVDVSLVIPWRSHPSRVAAFDFVCSFFSDFLNARDELWELILCDGDPSLPFNVSAARNAGVRAAKADVLLIVDADSFAEPEAIAAALDSAADGRMHFCFDTFVYLNEEESSQVLAGAQPNRRSGAPHESSVMVISRDAYWIAGGSDERFTHWGGEDNALRLAAESMLGAAQWHSGVGFTLHHESNRWCRPEQVALLQRYRDARLNRNLMVELLKEPGRNSESVR